MRSSLYLRSRTLVCKHYKSKHLIQICKASSPVLGCCVSFYCSLNNEWLGGPLNKLAPMPSHNHNKSHSHSFANMCNRLDFNRNDFCSYCKWGFKRVSNHFESFGVSVQYVFSSSVHCYRNRSLFHPLDLLHFGFDHSSTSCMISTEGRCWDHIFRHYLELQNARDCAHSNKDECSPFECF